MDNFENICWEGFKDNDDVHNITHQLKEIREHMRREHKSFARLSVVEQFKQCSTILCIVLHTSTGNLKAFSILSKSKGRGEMKYDILRDFKEPKTIHLKQSKKLLSNG